MRPLFVFGLICLGMFFGLPLLAELEPNACDARDRIAARSFGLGFADRSFGAFSQDGGRVVFKGAHAAPLSGLRCTTEYWRRLTRSRHVG
ncbi:MAG: hypothetical protein AB7O80_19800 [Acetobacteraceae bacterium]